MAIDLEISVKRTQSVYSLTSMQRNMLLSNQFLREPGLDIEQIVADLQEDLDVGAFEQAWQKVVRRHAVLRTGFRCDDARKPQQEVYDTLPHQFWHEDWSDLRSGEQKKKFAEWLLRDRRRGFNPGAPPLSRVALLRLREYHYRMVWTFHHLLLDAGSFVIVLKELFAFYEAAREGYQLVLGAPVSFKSYVEAMQLRDWSEGEQFWAEALQGFETPTPIVIARTKARELGAGERTHGEQALVFGGDETRKLGSAAHQLKVKLSTLVEGAWGLLLGRYAGEEDVVFGSVRGCRRETVPAAKSIVGLVINTVPLRIRIDPDAQVGQWLKNLRRNQELLREHEETPLEAIIGCWKAGPGGQLFQTLLNFQNVPWHEELALQGGEWSDRTFGIHNQPQHALWADCHGGKRLTLKIGYDRRRVDDEAVERMLEHFRNLIKALAASPNACLRDVKMLSAAERKSLLIEWNHTEVDYPRHKCVHEIFERHVSWTPEAPAVAGNGCELNYEELNRRANRLAYHLRGKGVGPEKIVGLCLERSTELVVGALAILKAGGAYLPLDPCYPRERLRFMLEDSGASIVLTAEPLRKLLADDGWDCICIDREHFPQESEQNPELMTRPGNLAYVIYTSGSTGEPKGVAVEHRSLTNLVVWHQRAYEVAPADRATLVAGPAFDASVWEAWPYLCTGASLHIPDEQTKVSPARLLEWMRQQRITLSFLPTPLAEAVMQEKWTDGMKLRALLTGGEKLQRPAPRGFGCWLTNHYGPTENTVVTTAALVEPDADAEVAPAIGFPIANTRVYVLDRYGEPVPVGVPGELHISGAGLARGYVNQPALTAMKFIPNPFGNGRADHARLYKTGDLVRYQSDGSLEFLGRTDRQIKIRGYRIEPGEIEAVLCGHPSIRQCVVIATKVEGGDRLTAFVVTSGERKPDGKELRDLLLQRLPEYMVPTRFAFLEEVPLTPNGKVDRKALAEMEPEPQERIIHLWTPTECAVAQIYAEVLRCGEVSREDSFFELGGHSLHATRVMSRVQNRLSADLPLQILFEAPTVEAFAAVIDGKRNGVGATASAGRNGEVEVNGFHKKPEQPGRDGDKTVPLSFAQERIWFFEQLQPGLPLHNVPLAMSVRGDLDLATLETGINEIVRRHEALRTAFSAVNGRPLAVVRPAAPLRIGLLDLSGMPEEDRIAEAQRLAGEEAKQVFDLSASPLLRVRVLKLGRDDHWLLVTMHHIVSDGWSMGIFNRELEQLYSACLHGKAGGLPELPIQFAAHAARQRERMTEEWTRRELEYWQTQLNGAQTVLDLPTDHARGVAQTYRGGIRHFTLASELAKDLEGMARSQGATLFMVLLAAFQELLRRYSGQERFLVGTPIAGRNNSETEALIGLFLNTQVLSSDLSGDPTVKELLRRVRSTCLGAYEHQELPFEKLVEAMHAKRDLSRSPLFQTLFVLQNQAMTNLRLEGTTIRSLPMHSGTAKYDLTVCLEEENGALNGYVEFNSDLFDAATIGRFAGHFETLLRGMAANPEERVSVLPWLTAPEQTQLLEEWNNTGTPFESEKCIHRFFEEHAVRDPRAIAAQFGEEQVTYEELNEAAESVAVQLRQMGIGPDIGVAICVHRSIEMLVGLLGILKAGGYYVPLDPGYPRERLRFMLEDSQATVLITHARFPSGPMADAGLDSGVGADEQERIGFAGRLRLIAQPQKTIAGRDSENRADLRRAVKATDLAYVIYTSGSTGKPKGVMVTHRNAANFFAGMDRVIGTTPGVWLCVTSISFDISVLELFWTLARGFKLVIHPDQDANHSTIENTKANGHAPSVPEQIARHKVTHLQCTPSLAGTLVLAPESVQAMRSLSKLLLGGEALPFSLVEKLRPMVSGDILNMYGPTETTVWSSSSQIGKADTMVRIGKPVANTRIYVLDTQRQPVPIGVPGELFIGGEGVARGYLNRSELTAERFIKDPFSKEPGARLYRTGDMARYDAEGRIEFLGRVDQQVKLRGHRIEVGEIEAVLRKHQLVKDVAVRVWENGAEDKRLSAYVVSANGEAPVAEELKGFLEQQLPAIMIPSDFVVLKSLPLTPNGKVDRKALPEPERDRSVLKTPFSAPGTEVERTIAGIWEELLGIKNVGLQDNFFDLGGHSLLAVQAQARIRTALGVDLPVVKVFQYPTVKSLAGYLNREEEQPRASSQRGSLKQAAYAKRARREQEALP